MNSEKIIAGVLVIAALTVIILGSAWLFTKPVFDTQRMIQEKYHPDAKVDAGLEDRSAVFYEEAFLMPEYLVFKLVPTENKTAYYTISYHVDRELSDDFKGEKEDAGISPDNPFILNITKKEGEWVDIFLTVTDENKTIVWKSDSGYT